MATTKEIMVHGVMTQVTELDSSVQEVDDAVAKSVWASNENLLHNWYLADPINQRGQTEYAGAVYGIDRWKAYSANFTVNIAEGGILLSAPAFSWLYQRIEKPEFLNNRQLTFSALIKNPNGKFRLNIYNQTSATSYLADFPASENIQLVSVTVTPSVNSGDVVSAMFYPGANDATEAREAIVVAAKLELAPVQTLAHQDADGNWVLNDPPPDKALELAKCKRYANMIAASSIVRLQADYVGTGVLYFTLPIDVALREGNPTIASYDLINVYSNGTQAGFAFSAINNGNTITIQAAKASHGLTSGILQMQKVLLSRDL